MNTSHHGRRPVHHRSTPLGELAGLVGVAAAGDGVAGDGAAGDGVAGDIAVTGVSQDSRAVRPGDLYVALPGARFHGAQFAGEALARGAVAAMGDRPLPGLPTLVVPDPRALAGPVAARILGDPSAAMDLYGVTGTNGKTSTTYLLHAALAASGVRAGMLSGIEVRGPAGEHASRRTTPEADEFQRELACLREDDVRAVSVEVSSHGLALHRVDGTRFATGVFTNLGVDHLDLHGDVENYFAAKASLFAPSRCGRAVVNVDDAFGRRLAASVSIPLVTYSPSGGAADFRASSVVAGARGTDFTVDGPGFSRRVRLPLLGAHQVDNALAAIAAAPDPAAAVRGVESVTQVPGRLDRVDVGQPFLALVDYVHNPAGQDRLFPYLRSLCRGRLHVVISITGERDPAKREPLGRNAARHADTVIVTDDSPHSEDPALLRAAAARGALSAGHADVLVVPGRGAAIREAVARAGPGDVVLVAGHGHLSRLITAGRSEPFDDRAALREALMAGWSRETKVG